MGNVAQTVRAGDFGSSISLHRKVTHPSSSMGRPRCLAYQSFTASGFLHLKKIPPKPVTRFMSGRFENRSQASISDQFKESLPAEAVGKNPPPKRIYFWFQASDYTAIQQEARVRS